MKKANQTLAQRRQANQDQSPDSLSNLARAGEIVRSGDFLCVYTIWLLRGYPAV